MRAPILIAAGLLTAMAACSGPAADVASDAADAPSATPDLALTAGSGDVPVVSDLELNLPVQPVLPQPETPTPEPESIPEPMPEPLGMVAHGDHGVAPEPVAVETSHVHPKADPDEAVSAPVPGGGKPRTGVTEGLGPVPDRGWDGIGAGGIIDDPNPIPGVTGRGGAVIIRGGIGGVDDDCAIHRPRTGTSGVGAGTLVNDRAPRGGALINERAPRASGGGAFPRGGGMVRGGIR